MNLENRLVEACVARGVTLATAESCTGGLVAARITAVSGSSAAFLGGIVSYANTVKMEVLGVPQGVLQQFGAVSEACAAAMADGARQRLKADYAAAVTGIAGPTGGSPEKPVGLVCFGLAAPDAVRAEHRIFSGDRGAIRFQATEHALTLLLEAVNR
ncbi:MAG TPA: CinA family protein [Kiritimatiellia bacterium]|nr:CinA family protein [Kiritimatiellia bacterium]HRU69589.1 CinA family protein [Kiritimatiellia bacterium]